MTAGRDRLAPWIDAVERRVATRSSDAVGPPLAVVVAHLRAVHQRDLAGIGATLAPDARVRLWGWSLGGHREWFGRDGVVGAYEEAFTRLGDRLVTVRGDIDRFFPGETHFGLDGEMSWLTAAAGPSRLVSRRVACFGTVRDDQLTSIEVYCGVHEQSRVATAETDHPCPS